jgi:hypothetical protein
MLSKRPFRKGSLLVTTARLAASFRTIISPAVLKLFSSGSVAKSLHTNSFVDKAATPADLTITGSPIYFKTYQHKQFLAKA